MVQLAVYLLLGSCFFPPMLVWAAAPETYTLVIRNHKFEPALLDIPAGRKVKIVVDNQDPTAEEFESTELNREKVVGGGRQIVVFLGPLEPGSYKYFGEFHRQTAQGTILAQ
jgi:plastocyanin